jgi:hypothetical protein
MSSKLHVLGPMGLSVLLGVDAYAQGQAPQPERGFDPRRWEDRAFDPNEQVVPLRASNQRPRLRLVEIVPVSAALGRPVPLVSVEAPALRLNHDQRWVIDIVLTNNSPLTASPELKSNFMNGDRAVEIVTVLLEGIGAGQKVFFQVYDPMGETYVNLAPCNVTNPMP